MTDDDALQEPGFYLTTLTMAARYIVQQDEEGSDGITLSSGGNST